jgi:diguanylate cyclase (GGDEF)-like protein
MNANTPNGTENVRRRRRGLVRSAPDTTNGGGRGTLLLALLGTHVPILVLVAYLALSFPGGLAVALPVLGATLAGTLAAGAIAFRELRTLLASVSRASRALRDYRERGETPALPADAGGEGGRLLRDVQETLCRLEGVIGSLEQLSAKDPLTGVYNRRACEERLAEDAARASRGEGRLALAVVDVDCLKEVNDRWGHGAGDACLRHLAYALGRNIREGDWIARWGGDEFVVAFWGVEGPADPRAALRRAGEYLQRNPVQLPRGEEVGVGFSAGVCTHGGDVEGARELFSKADAALIAAKKGGRDRVVAYGVGAHAGAVEAPSVNGWYQRRPKSPSPAPELSLSTPGRPVQGLPRPLRTPAANPQDPRQKRGEP